MRLQDAWRDTNRAAARLHLLRYYSESQGYAFQRLDRKVEEQIADLLHGIEVDPHVLPQLRRLYREHIDALKGPDVKEQAVELRDRLERLHV